MLESLYKPSDLSGGIFRINRKFAKICTLLCLASVILASYYQAIYDEFLAPSHDAVVQQSYARDYKDIPPLLHRISECKTILQMSSYWHEDYTKSVPFYRPMSLTWYWLEYHALGADHFNRWDVVSIFLNLIFCVLLWFLVRDMTGSFTAACITLLVYAGSRDQDIGTAIMLAFKLQGTPALVASQCWKDQPTLISDCLTVLAMLLAFHKKWLAGLISALVAVLFKESGWITYPLVFVLLIGTRKLRDVPPYVYGAAFLAIALPMLGRYASHMGIVGGPQGQPVSLHGWFVRYAFTVCGAYIINFYHSNWITSLLGSACYLIVMSKSSSVNSTIPCDSRDISDRRHSCRICVPNFTDSWAGELFRSSKSVTHLHSMLRLYDGDVVANSS
jgi:hypothetical protein